MSSQKFSVRQICPGDDTAGAEELLIRFFREEAFTTPAGVIRSHCRIFADTETCGLFIAETPSSLGGVATVSMQYGIEFGWLGEMGDLYVLPAVRGLGIAHELVRAVEEFLRMRGVSAYQVTVTPRSKQVHRLKEFYLKLGFSQEGREILYRLL